MGTVTHPTYAPSFPRSCPCCNTAGRSQTPAFSMCDPCYLKAVRLMHCEHKQTTP